MYAVLQLFNSIVDLYIYCLIAMVILSWLLAFGVINTYNPLLGRIMYFLESITEPILQHIRRFVPVIGGIDLSVLVLFFGIQFIRQFINEMFLY